MSSGNKGTKAVKYFITQSGVGYNYIRPNFNFSNFVNCKNELNLPEKQEGEELHYFQKHSSRPD